MTCQEARLPDTSPDEAGVSQRGERRCRLNDEGGWLSGRCLVHSRSFPDKPEAVSLPTQSTL
jgi:hypothetical protein